MKRSIILLVCLLFLATTVNAESIKDVIGFHKNTAAGTYLEMKKDGSAHVYWAKYDVTFNYGSVKSKESTHDTDYMTTHRPKKTDDDGNLTPEFLKWLASLKYKHLTDKGERLYLLTRAGLDSTALTEKSGKYYFYVWSSDESHDRFVAWCKKNGVQLKH